MKKNNNLLKMEIRKQINDQREKLSEEDKMNYDERIFTRLTESQFYKDAKNVFIYVSFGKEVDTLKIISRLLSEKKVVYVPKVINKKEGMKAIKISTLDDLKVGYFNILEPVTTEEINPKDIDLCVVPGVAFDNDGGRLGYGGGFYDRFLCNISPHSKIIALAYKFQIVEKIPMETYDIKVQRIITT